MSDLDLLFGVAFLLIGLFGLWASKYKPEKLIAVAMVLIGCYLLYLASCAAGIFCIPPDWTSAARNLINHIVSRR